MTREEAIEILKIIIDEGWLISDIEKCPAIDACEMAIKALEQTRWIPVSERLPETLDDVLVYDGADMFVAWYWRKGKHEGWNSHSSDFDPYTAIEAWMPLPEPYRAESEGKE